eukprot:m.38021 g.38021  ORF g.38021 m.38021 type:complete len:75 (+) comp7766_c0_seq2:2823-3047(+)
MTENSCSAPINRHLAIAITEARIIAGCWMLDHSMARCATATKATSIDSRCAFVVIICSDHPVAGSIGQKDGGMR